MAGLKTVRNDKDVGAFLDSVQPEQRRLDSVRLCHLMQTISDEPPEMWGESIVGFGSYRYRYENGKPGEWFLTGFSPRKQALTIYIMPGFAEFEGLIGRLGPRKTGRSSLYVTRLARVDMGALEMLERVAFNRFHLMAGLSSFG